VLTKADLVPDAEHWRADVAAAAPGVEVLAGSAVTGAGLDPLAERLEPGVTVALLGPSGAGKSTLTNALAGATVMVTRALRGDGKGRHTTTHRELVELPSGALLVDTPGLRSVGLVGDEEALATAFADVDGFAAGCRFRDCAHHGEPGCAVLAAVESGELDERRYASWRKLQPEVRHQERRVDARLRAAEKARWKSVQKSLRRSGVTRP
jgi:ribosome biogenesis GTPase